MRPATARGRRSSSPQAANPELANRLKELEASRKDEERQKKLAERKRAQELREAKKKLSRELQGAQRMLTRSEQEVNKLTGQLTRTEQQAQQATVKKNREGEKAEEGIGRIRQKHGKVGGVLREKMANVGQARGRLAHVQFALAMLEKGVIVAVGENENPVQSPDNTVLNQPQRRRIVRRVPKEDGSGETEEVEEYEEVEPETAEEEYEGTATMREELEQLKEENLKLREHLADADKRCTTAVQLLQQAQEVLETRMDDASTIDFKVRVDGIEKEQETIMDFDNVSTMQGSPEGSTQHSPSAQPQPEGAPANVVPGLPSLLAAPRPAIKQIPVYAGTFSPPSRMVSCPMNATFARYQPMQLPRQDATLPPGATLIASQSTPAIYPQRVAASMTIPSSPGPKMYPAEPVAIPATFKPPAEPLSMPVR
mmetsp:Transcript_52840/g.98991  ORF Transcript_52840/g.98991 Transcript_52840/m.98991 type:complete len:426 (+) Transcript_52840:50-1327(+)